MIPKFRAWSKKFKRMYEVTLVDYENGDVGLKDDHGGVAIGDIKQLILMQSTGMFDKNGVEIFDGDIVLTTRLIDYTYKNFKGVVKMLEGRWLIDTGKDAVGLWTEVDENEAIGNIYQNSELLESVEK
ncbi:YopX family protein [Streptococcus agalactiae]|uniref:YopX family protein n=1 Tax=Streptococcus agalactiae TaxID=1311 RepID=UPI00363051F2